VAPTPAAPTPVVDVDDVDTPAANVEVEDVVTPAANQDVSGDSNVRVWWSWLPLAGVVAALVDKALAKKEEKAENKDKDNDNNEG
jgi:epidermal growth factor receptor substrate 15